MTSASLASSSVCTPPSFPPFQPLLNSTPVQFVGTNLGEWNGSHTSNVSIVYSNSTIPTPWPLLLAGQLISLGTAALTLAKGEYSYSSPNSKIIHTKAIALAGPVLYQVIRAVASFASLCKALEGTGGHFMPVSGSWGLAISLMPAYCDEEMHVITRLLAGIGILIAFLEASIMANVQIFHPKNIGYYGKWFTTGGSCPRLVGDLDGWACFDQYYVGCGVDTLISGNQSSVNADNTTLHSGQMPTRDPNFLRLHNLIAVSEYGFSLITWAMAPLAVLGQFAVLIWFSYENLDKFFGFDTASTEEGGAYGVSLASLPTILIFIVVFFPMHYTSQTKPVSFVVQDSIGNISAAALKYNNGGQPVWQNWTGEGVDGKTWTDFFLVETPADRYGFLHYWWNTEEVSILRRVALM
jgi:hypothetical protein